MGGSEAQESGEEDFGEEGAQRREFLIFSPPRLCLQWSFDHPQFVERKHGRPS